jgi:transcription elongation factor Elf1
MRSKNKKNKLDITMAIKFKCNKCGFERLVYREEFKKMTQKTFKNNKLFICDNCKIRMNPISVEVDY